ncbi:Crp/Fnr family transcriptional regulator [Rhodoferax koreense]|uniref:Crp/Fnr family transcriptional regulator n=1 Tax=Rhodoferax koreensis TaxID=1842727 RepID=A0A1P8K4G2_9BURK|nr:Crp/Fnr family transcriptional regulator [Rhodoferax koreense]
MVEQAHIADTAALLNSALAPSRRIVHAGEAVYQAGIGFTHLHFAHSGAFKVVNLAQDGREQIVGLKFRGDWLGLDGIANGVYACDAVAMDTGELWSFRYDALLAACAQQPALLTALHQAMGLQMAQSRNSLMSVCTLPADARVANFLHEWALALQARGLRTDQIALRLTRAEIGNHLGMTLETVSRALTLLSRMQLIAFPVKGRRDIAIPDIDGLDDFVQDSLAGLGPVLH